MNRLLTVSGILLALVGFVGIVDALSNGRERHPGTLIRHGLAAGTARPGSDPVPPSLRVRLDDNGTMLNADITKLSEAVGRQGGSLKVDVETRDHGKAVERVRFHDTWYGTAATTARLGLGIAFVLIAALLWAVVAVRRRLADRA